jgi:hypothetical protein
MSEGNIRGPLTAIEQIDCAAHRANEGGDPWAKEAILLNDALLAANKEIVVKTKALQLQQRLMANLMAKGNINWGQTFSIDFVLMNESLIATDEALRLYPPKEKK